MKFFLSVVIFILWLLPVYARQNIIPSPGLFLHTDKIIYTNGEKIWFTAFLLNPPAEYTDKYHTLYTLLINNKTKAVAVTERFVIDRAVSKGMITLPDTLRRGNYTLIACTNQFPSDQSEQCFRQQIIIRSLNRLNYAPGKNDVKKKMSNLPSATVKVLLKPDSTRYHQRSKTCWKIMLRDIDGKPVHGIFSVACAFLKRIPDGYQPEIRRYFYKGGVGADSIDKSIHPQPDAPITGKVLFKGKPPAESVKLVLIKPDKFIPLHTNADGSFVLAPASLAAPFGSELLLSVASKKKQTMYDIILRNEYDSLNKWLAGYNCHLPSAIAEIPDTAMFSPSEASGSINLKEVSVTAKLEPETYEGYPLKIDTSCGAMVCAVYHWKCLLSFPLQYAVEGQYYYDSPTQSYILFKGCPQQHPPEKNFLKKIKPTIIPPDFPLIDYNKEKIDRPEVSSTLFWNYLIVTDTNGEASFSFFTNDLKGEFICTVQGISTNGVFSEHRSIQVD